jgi:hypothetical protein
MSRQAQVVSRWLAGLLMLAAMMMLGGVGQAAAVQSPALPQAAGMSPDGTPGTIYYGATPAGGGANKPVLVFVQGLHGQANTWWTGGNDMYSDAYYAGYRTAFVDLIDAGGSGGSIWNNGQMLAGQLNTITAHYGVSSVNIVAHSKGGLDSNAAIVHYGAAPLVQNLFQLSSPNGGSQLADLSYSWWAGWLASILGQRDDAVYSLQTGQMSSFRSLSDGRSENSYVHYYTSAGTSHGSIFGALWYGGAYLQVYGSNDGAVTVTSAHHPLGTHIFTDGNLDHDQMPIGHNTWSRVQNYVSSYWRGLSPEQPPLKAEVTSPYASLPAGDIIRGGQVSGNASERFAVENGAAALNIAALTNSGVDVTLRGPDGRIYQPVAVQQGDRSQPLGAATYHIFQISNPASGAWQAQFSNAPSLGIGKAQVGAYLLVAEVDSNVQVSLSSDSAALTFAPASAARFTLHANDGATNLRNLTLTSHLSGSISSATQTVAGNDDRISVNLPSAPGVYNLSLTVRGLDASGAAFERSLTTSFAVGN